MYQFRPILTMSARGKNTTFPLGEPSILSFGESAAFGGPLPQDSKSSILTKGFLIERKAAYIVASDRFQTDQRSFDESPPLP